MSSLKSQYKDTSFSCHFHDTRALGLANVYASLVAGINKFDSCIGGLGGCPFAPNSSGNLATEDLVSMLEMMNIKTGVNLDKLIHSRELASEYTSLSLKGAYDLILCFINKIIHLKHNLNYCLILYIGVLFLYSTILSYYIFV